MKKPIFTSEAPAAIGPYSQAVVYNGIVYCSGQIPLDPASGQMMEGDIAAQTVRVLDSLQAVLEAAGKSFDNVMKTTVYLADMKDFGAMNTVYARYFQTPYPARTTIQAAGLPLGAAVEIEVVAR